MTQTGGGAAERGPHIGFKRHLRAEIVPGEAAYLLSARGVTVLHGPHVTAVAGLLDGTRTLPEVLSAADPHMPTEEAGRLLGQLARAGLIGYHRRSATHRGTDLSAQAYWDLVGLDGAGVEESLAGTSVTVLGVGAVDVRAARSACRASGLTVTESSGPAENTFSLVLCSDYLAPELHEIDAAHRAAGRPWLLAKPAGAETWVGPVFRPGAGGCWSCLAHPLRGHRRSELLVQQAIGSMSPVSCPDASLAAGRAMGLHAAVLEAVKWVAGIRHGGQDAVYTLDTLSGVSRQHQVRRRPQCPECGDPGIVSERASRPVVPLSRPKAESGGSNDRALTPEQVRGRYGHLVSRLTGVVPEIKREQRLPEPLNCYVSGHNPALRANSLGERRGHLRSLSGGKGTTPIEAEVGALCEAVERYSATRQGDEATVLDSLTGLGEAAVHPNDCQLFADRQFRGRKRWNAEHSGFHQVPAPFSADRPVHWTPVWSLTEGAHRLLPTSMLYFGPGTDDASLGPWADSNGNAAGSSLEDAIVQGFLELVERDAVALWWYNRLRRPGVDLDAFDEPWLATTRATYARMNRHMWVLDITSDLGIPVMVAVSRRVDKPAEDITFGFGAHFDPRLALRRAVTEMCQLLPAVAEATPEGSGYAECDPELRAWWSRATVGNQPYLLPDPAELACAPGNYRYRPRTDLREDITAAEDLVRARGMDLLVLEQTRPDLELPVVKVIVPGLRHFWTRFAPGRLFDVPVTLGLVDRPTRYEHLNPVPLFA